MKDRLALRPDLSQCALEDRVLLAIEVGLYPNPFLSVVSSSNQFSVPGTSTSSAGINAGGSSGSTSISLSGSTSNSPGPNWYYLMIGSNPSSVSVGSRVGGSLSLYSISNLSVLPANAMVHPIVGASSLGGGGGGADDSGGGGGSTNAGGFSNFGGYGASFSSGYSFALGSGNNYGMFSSTQANNMLGSVPVHSYGGGGDLLDAPELQDPTAGSGNSGTPTQNSSNAPVLSPGYGVQGPNGNLYEHLLGKNPGQLGVKPRMGVQTGGPAGGGQGGNP